MGAVGKPYNLFDGKPGGGDHLRDPAVDGTILKWIKRND
jgi:hypothetical protein